MLAPILLAHPKRKGRGAATGKDADRAIGGFEAVLYMKWLPGAAFFVLGKSHSAVGITVALGTHVAVSGQRAALEILRQQAVSAPNGRVGMVIGSHGSRPG